MNAKKIALFIGFLLLSLAVAAPSLSHAQTAEQKTETQSQKQTKTTTTDNTGNNIDATHNVSVDVMLIPVFVTGPDGKPVFDLKKEDFQLYADGKQLDIAHFIQFDFHHSEEVIEAKERERPSLQTAAKRPPTTTVSEKQPSRAVFIIIDSVFNSFFGYRRARAISADIINNGAKDDVFFILENRAGSGLRFVSGPGDSKKQMLKKLNSLKLPSVKWSKSLHLTREWDYEADEDAFDPVHPTANMENMALQKKQLEKVAYKNQVRRFTHFLSKFKYALKTVTRPKVVFLISEGIAKASFKNLQEVEKVQSYGSFTSAFMRTEKRYDEKTEARDMHLFKDLQRIVEAINQGGSVLYTVNPGKFQRDNEASGEMSLRFLASESGGRYVAGRQTEKICKRIKSITAAYYEIAFIPDPQMGKNIPVNVKCVRKGVKVSSLKQTERMKIYAKMEPVEKKLFALNMVTGGGWSRMNGKVVRIKYKKLAVKKKGSDTVNDILIPLPKKMMNCSLDMFSVSIDPTSKKVDVKMVTSKVTKDAHLIIKKSNNSQHFFVLIEPEHALCIYNQV